LTVSDNGVGLGAARSEGGFGLQLVALMCGQLRGTLERTSEGGTSHRVRFTETI
jgi:two-component sensor histidine kinase